jgi:hypothetical protein
MNDDRIQELLDRVEIEKLIHDYARAQDRLDAPLHRSVFWDDAQLEYGIYTGGPDGFVEFAQRALSAHLSNHHMMGQISLEFGDDEVFGESYYQAYHRLVNEAGEDRDLVISGRYVDRFERRGGVWKIAYRCELVDWSRDEASADGWFAGSGMLAGRRKPDDALYDRERIRGLRP